MPAMPPVTTVPAEEGMPPVAAVVALAPPAAPPAPPVIEAPPVAPAADPSSPELEPVSSGVVAASSVDGAVLMPGRDPGGLHPAPLAAKMMMNTVLAVVLLDMLLRSQT
jgi:hypothetical protein